MSELPMLSGLVDPADPPERQKEKLFRIAEALMRRVEQDNSRNDAAYAQFERAAMLEDQVRQRTADLEKALDLLNESNAQLARANRETEAARANLASAIETVEEGFALFGPDDRLVLHNRRFAMHLGDLRAFLSPGLHFADYIDRVSSSDSIFLPAGTSRADWRDKRMRRHRDQHSIFNVPLTGNRWVQVSEHRTPDGGTVILQTDVTDIMRLEREAREKLMDDQAIRIRATLDHLNQGVGIFDRESRLVGWNTRLTKLLSLPSSQLRFGAYFDTVFERVRLQLVPDSSGILPSELLEWVSRDDRRRPLSFEFRHRNGATLDFFAREMPDRGFVVSLTDITAERESARRLAEANEFLEQRVNERTVELEDALTEAERANASKSRFVAAASHDLLQPLSAAKLYIDALAETDRDPEEAGTVRKARNALESVENIIEALLDISRLDAGTAALEQSNVPLGRLLSRLRDDFAPLAEKKGLNFRVVNSSAVVRSNPLFLTRILQNLIVNAIRYTEDGTVLVGARRNGGSLRLEVWDTGTGIAEEDQEEIFQEFRRLKNSRGSPDGLGLGLAIVERACQRLGHRLSLWSVPDQGSGFFVNVDLTQASGPPHAETPAPRTTERLCESGLIVLLVENDADVRRATSLLLGKWNASVLDVTSGREALELLEEIQIRPDAMLVDYQLNNGESGLDLIGLLHARYGNVPTRLISANRSADLRHACAAAGVGLITKPLDARQLESFLLTAIPDQD